MGRYPSNSRNELDIELSRWGDPSGNNAQYVVQPFFAAENPSRFTVPPGSLTYMLRWEADSMLRWEADSLSFTTIRDSSADSAEKLISTHTFTSGIPTPANETVHIDLYDFHRSESSSEQPAEAVIERFEFIPPSQTANSARP